MSDFVTILTPKTCDFCRHPSTRAHGQPARFDFKTFQGPWANACPQHYLEWRAYDSLGTGKGQLLLMPGESLLEVINGLDFPMMVRVQ